MEKTLPLRTVTGSTSHSEQREGSINSNKGTRTKKETKVKEIKKKVSQGNE